MVGGREERTMKKSEAEYYKILKIHGYGVVQCLVKLNRTGLCKVVTIDGVHREYVEHKRWLFNDWIPAEDIVIKSTSVFNCDDVNGKEVQ